MGGIRGFCFNTLLLWASVIVLDRTSLNDFYVVFPALVCNQVSFSCILAVYLGYAQLCGLINFLMYKKT